MKSESTPPSKGHVLPPDYEIGDFSLVGWDLPFDDLTHGLDAGLLGLRDECEEPTGTPGGGRPGSGNPERLHP